MSTYPTEPAPGADLELPVEEQLERARPWNAADEPVIDDLSDEEERAFLDAITR